jgi:hypothetical protein
MRDKPVPVNPVTRDERRCCLPCGPTKSTTGVKAKASAPPHATPHLRGLDIPWCVTSNPHGGTRSGLRQTADTPPQSWLTVGKMEERRDRLATPAARPLVPRPGGATGSPSVLQDELAAQHVLASVPATRRSVDPPSLVSWRSAPPSVPIAHAGPLPSSVWNAAEPSC